MINVSIVGSFSQTNKGDRVGFRVCGPNSTRDDGAISDRKKKHSEWMSKARKKGICRPLPLVVDLKPERGGPDSEKSGQTIVLVRKCSLLYSPIENRVTPDCHSVKSVKRTVHFKGGGGHVNSYEIYDDVICLARVTSEEEETGAKNTPSKKHAKKCPWPFRRRKTGHCSCRRKNKDSAGYLVYRSCQMVRKGVWRLQDKQQECVHLGRCQPPKCDGTRVYDAARGRCVLAAQPQLTSTAASAGPVGQGAAASHPIDGQRQPPPRTAQEATRSPADT